MNQKSGFKTKYFDIQFSIILIKSIIYIGNQQFFKINLAVVII